MLEPPAVLLNYRRVDSAGSTRQIRDRLAHRLGSDAALPDLPMIPQGPNFTDVIARAVANVKVMLCGIGPKWRMPPV